MSRDHDLFTPLYAVQQRAEGVLGFEGADLVHGLFDLAEASLTQVHNRLAKAVKAGKGMNKLAIRLDAANFGLVNKP